jgi:hypothetical protein
MGNHKDIKIETEEYVVLDDKLKLGARALRKKIETPIETLEKNTK